METIIKALLAEMPRLADDGWTNQGHWYECPNGHPYIITEHDGAAEASLCPECRLPIGGTSHKLQASNNKSGGLRAFASQVSEQGT